MIPVLITVVLLVAPGLAFGQSAAPAAEAGCGAARESIPAAPRTNGFLSLEGVQANRDLSLPVNQPPLRSRRGARKISDGPRTSYHCRTLEWHAGPTHTMARRALRTEARNFFARPAGTVTGGPGLHPDVLKAVQPWLRGGYLDGSGAEDPADNKYGTLFGILPTSYPARSSFLDPNFITGKAIPPEPICLGFHMDFDPVACFHLSKSMIPS